MENEFVPWSDDYKFGIRAIDNDHMMLFEVLNNLHQSVVHQEPAADIAEVVGVLNKYVSEHFRREEAFMTACGYPELAEHLKAHAEIAKIVHALDYIIHHQPDSLDMEKVLTFMRDWLAKHILQEDVKYVPYMQGAKKGVKGAQAVSADGEPAVQDGGPGTVTVEVKLEVPTGKEELLGVCAKALTEGGADTEELEQHLRRLAPHYPTHRILALAEWLLKEGEKLPGDI